MAAAAPAKSDPHTQLRRLYTSLLEEQNRFDEFKQLLALYPVGDEAEESAEAMQVRARLNATISAWLCGHFDGLTAPQVALWRSIVVEERINLSLSPWKDTNGN